MCELIITLKSFLSGIFGFYLFKYITPRQEPVEGFCSLFYGLFSLLAIFGSNGCILHLFITGVIFAMILKLFLRTINERLVPNLQVIWFGLLNILNYYFLLPILDVFINNSSDGSAVFLLITVAAVFLIDLSLVLRRYL